MIFHDSTPKFIVFKIILFSKHQKKAEFNNLDDSEVVGSDFLATFLTFYSSNVLNMMHFLLKL
jgi:hypothetical protein